MTGIMRRNTPQLWDQFWMQNTSIDVNLLEEVENSIGWQRIVQIILREYRSLTNLKVIELGAGSGTSAALMAKGGAKVTVLDYSENALRAARGLFSRYRLDATFIKQDVLSLDVNLHNIHDISMSFGLAEHFKVAQRKKIIKAHFDVLKKGGMTFISVPNKFDLLYRVALYIANHSIPWNTGEEYPYSRNELVQISQQVGIPKYAFLGDSLFYSLNFYYPFRALRKINKQHIKVQRGSFLDQYLSYGLIFYGIK